MPFTVYIFNGQVADVKWHL